MKRGGVRVVNALTLPAERRRRLITETEATEKPIGRMGDSLMSAWHLNLRQRARIR
jgi:hypothetical protein